MTLSFRDIADILKAIDESNAEEINIEVEGIKLSVSKSGSRAAPIRQVASTESASVEDESVPESTTAAESGEEQNKPTSRDAPTPSGHEILRAPMVGTFYRRPSPEDDPFVEVGSTVKQGDPLCLIEVMKLYTTIESTVAGEIVSIFADDGNLVEFDQQLFLIKT